MSTVNVLPTDPRIAYVGRVAVEERAANFAWSGSGFCLAVRGGTVRASLSGPGGSPDEAVWIAVYVDDKRTQTVMLQEGSDRWVTLASDLPADAVTAVRVVKLTEASHGTATLHGLAVTGALELPMLPLRRMVCIGDSITCGFGVLGKETDPFSTQTEDITLTCGWLLAHAFHAQRHIVSVSGYGLTMSNARNTDHVLPRVYPYADFARTKPWDHDCYQPDLVVVNVGTNDEFMNVPAADIRAGVHGFLTQLRAAHPHATLLWVYGFMKDGYVPVIREEVERFAQTDDKVHFLHAAIATGDVELGSAAHPSAAANARLAKTLQPQIAAIMGW